MKEKKATKEQTREAILKCLERAKDYKPLPMGKDGECQWPKACKCQDCLNYHPLM